MGISYINGGKELVEFTQVMWEKLTAYHEGKSENFKMLFSKITFDQRIKSLMDDTMQVNIILAKDDEVNGYIGYIISSVSQLEEGTVESLYVDPNYRGENIGDYFMNHALDWIESKEPKKTIIGVSAGNEQVYSFYERYGFYPKVTLLSRKPKVL